ncbi:MAG: hypothetical protein P8Y10_15740 [Gemmatimonadales bacterium]
MRTKLVFALVAVSLGSMLALGAFTYRSARGLLREDSLEQLEGLAETKKEGLEHIISGWQDRAHLIASRTQLLLSLRDYNRSASPVARDQRRLHDFERPCPATPRTWATASDIEEWRFRLRRSFWWAPRWNWFWREIGWAPLKSCWTAARSWIWPAIRRAWEIPARR